MDLVGHRAFAEHAVELTGLRPVVMLAWLSLVATAGSYLLFARGCDRLPAATVAALNLAEPLFRRGFARSPGCRR